MQMDSSMRVRNFSPIFSGSFTPALCLISYSSKDPDFARSLHADRQHTERLRLMHVDDEVFGHFRTAQQDVRDVALGAIDGVNPWLKGRHELPCLILFGRLEDLLCAWKNRHLTSFP